MNKLRSIYHLWQAGIYARQAARAQLDLDTWVAQEQIRIQNLNTRVDWHHTQAEEFEKEAAQ